MPRDENIIKFDVVFECGNYFSNITYKSSVDRKFLLGELTSKLPDTLEYQCQSICNRLFFHLRIGLTFRLSCGAKLTRPQERMVGVHGASTRSLNSRTS